MKVFFGYNMTENRKNEHFDGEIFLCDRVNDAQKKTLDAEMDNLEALGNKAQLPQPLRILITLCALCTVICLGVILRSWGNNISIATLYARMPLLFYIGGICAIIWIALTVLSRKKAKTVMESDEAVLTINHSNAIAENILSALGVPPNTPRVDFFAARYKSKGDKISIKAWGIAQFCNAELFAYTENGMLYLADVFQKFAVPLTEATGIRKIKKHVTMDRWNKDISHNKGEYKQYRLTKGQHGEYHMRYYYALCILHNGETYELYFPPYELDILQKLTGLQAEE